MSYTTYLRAQKTETKTWFFSGRRVKIRKTREMRVVLATLRLQKGLKINKSVG